MSRTKPNTDATDATDAAGAADATGAAGGSAGTADDAAEGSVEVDERSDRELLLEAQISRLEATLRQKEARLDEVFRAYRAADDEFKRVRERLERDLRRDMEGEKHHAIGLFFEVADNLERSLEAARANPTPEAILSGLQLVSQQFKATLDKLGVKAIVPKGAPFNTDEHEAVGVMPVPSPDMHQQVVEVFRAGYRLGDTVLRPAMVMVGQYNK